ncbi:MAG: type IV-A pilus assembly ATPase PilB [Nitrospinota bacterium]|nr:MAG: type IV-A pilus assembly ATPase PilB [Nitrospinota bacterium]
MTERVGELLVRANLITREQLEQALAHQKTQGGRLSSNLAKLGFISEEEIVHFLSRHYGVPFFDLSDVEIEPAVIQLLPASIVQKHFVVPIRRSGNTLTVAMEDPSNIDAIDDITFMTGYHVEVVVASETAIRRIIDQYYDAAETLRDVMEHLPDEQMEVLEEEEEISVNELQKASEEAPVIKLVNVLLADAIKKRASDIHIEPYEKSFRIRFRIDGTLHEVMQPPVRLKQAITSRIKVMSDLDISERRLPQDGRMKVKLKDKEVDFRVSTLPTLFGEKVVLRLLDKSNLMLDMTKLGFEPKALADFERAIQSPYGMVLVTGPTGSGKTTTLYSALDRLNKPDINIMTAEDPVEFNLKGINQVQIRESIGLSFAAALRSFLRQDPDIIMVGEIRDYETAEIAVKAALTGHLVLSTLHTNDAPSTINRLLNMGVEPFLVASSVLLIVAQRLARRVCEGCKEEIKVPEKVLREVGFTEEEIAEGVTCYRGQGCERCNKTGYKGRVALYEVLPVSDEIKELILEGATSLEIKREAVRLGMSTLRRSGLLKVREGVTSLEEVLKVTMGD